MAEKIIDVPAENVSVVSSEIISVNESISVKQLPIIENKLQALSDQIVFEVEEALKLEPTAENKSLIKDKRKNLNAFFKELEQKRIEVKKAISEPYNQFEEVYKRLISNIIKPATEKLSQKVDSIDNIVKEKKRTLALTYFEEYRQANNIDFVSFDDVHLNITLNISDKKIKETCKGFIDKIVDDIKLIGTQEHTAEIYVEYKKTLDVKKAITDVSARYEAIRIEQERLEAEKAQKQKEAERVEQVEAIVEEETLNVPTPIMVPEEEVVSVPEPQEEAEELQTTAIEQFEVAFRVVGTKEQIKALIAFMKTEGINYDSI